MIENLISVIIPVFNCEKYLQEAIDSVYLQKYRPIELIVVDDGSNDKTAVIAKSNPTVKYIYQENQGSAVARNTGLNHANGKWISFLDADDFWATDFLSLFLAVLQEEPFTEIVQGKIETFNDSIGKSEPPYFLCQLGTALFRRSVFEKVGLFESEFKMSQDIDWFVRAWEHNVLIHREELVVLHYRKHDQNITSNIPLNLHYRRLMFLRHINRMRKNGTPDSAITLMEFIGKKLF